MNGPRENFLARTSFASVIKTDAEDGATCSTRRMTSCITFDCPIRSPSLPDSRNCRTCKRRHLPVISADMAQRAVQQGSQDTGALSGFSMYQNAPASIAAMMRSSLPFPVMIIAAGRVFTLAQVSQQVQSVHSGQFHVGDQRRGRKFGKTRQRVLGAAHAQHFVSPSSKQRFVADARVFLVLNDEDSVGCRFRSFKAGRFSHAICAQSSPERLAATSNLPAASVAAKLRSHATQSSSDFDFAACNPSEGHFYRCAKSHSWIFRIGCQKPGDRIPMTKTAKLVDI